MCVHVCGEQRVTLRVCVCTERECRHPEPRQTHANDGDGLRVLCQEVGHDRPGESYDGWMEAGGGGAYYVILIEEQILYAHI